jgi:hypothetical protein
MSERTLEELFYRGVVLVEVGFSLGGGFLEAQTDSSVMGYADLGGEIRVTLYEDVIEDKDGSGYARPEAWAELLRETRNMLARCMILGRMKVVASEGYLLQTDEENSESIEKAKKLLGEEFFDITFDTAMRALKERYEEEAAVRGGLRIMMNLMEEEGLRRGLNKEERGRMTIGEAFGPKEENASED